MTAQLVIHNCVVEANYQEGDSGECLVQLMKINTSNYDTRCKWHVMNKHGCMCWINFETHFLNENCIVIIFVWMMKMCPAYAETYYCHTAISYCGNNQSILNMTHCWSIQVWSPPINTYIFVLVIKICPESTETQIIHYCHNNQIYWISHNVYQSRYESSNLVVAIIGPLIMYLVTV